MLEPIGWVLLKSSKHINKEGSITRLLSCRGERQANWRREAWTPVAAGVTHANPGMNMPSCRKEGWKEVMDPK